MKVLKTIKTEFLHLLPPTIFFFIGFILITITQRLILREHGLPLTGFGMAAIGALLVGKVVLIINHMPFMNRFPDKPLIYNIIWKTNIYFLAAFLVRYIEHIVPMIREYGEFMQANQHMLMEISWPHFCLVQMWLLVLFLVYCTLSELVHALGREKVIQLFFGGYR